MFLFITILFDEHQRHNSMDIYDQEWVGDRSLYNRPRFHQQMVPTRTGHYEEIRSFPP